MSLKTKPINLLVRIISSGLTTHKEQIGPDGQAILKSLKLAGLLLLILSLLRSLASTRPARAVASNSAYAWGNNASGQLGNGTCNGKSTTPEAITFPAGVTGFTAFSGGGSHNLAKGSDGKLFAWGDNLHGQLGDSTNTNKNSTVPVSLAAGVNGFTVFSACDSHSLGIGSNGRLYAWGYNSSGRWEKALPLRKILRLW